MLNKINLINNENVINLNKELLINENESFKVELSDKGIATIKKINPESYSNYDSNLDVYYNKELKLYYIFKTKCNSFKFHKTLKYLVWLFSDTELKSFKVKNKNKEYILKVIKHHINFYYDVDIDDILENKKIVKYECEFREEYINFIFKTKYYNPYINIKWIDDESVIITKNINVKIK
jgi:hypothetical protein